MIDQGQKLISLINSNLGEVESLSPADGEFYFSFRDRAFSVRRDENGDCTLFAYPKWRGAIPVLVELMERGVMRPDAIFAAIPSDERDVRSLYEWLRVQDLGLDQLYKDLGIG